MVNTDVPSKFLAVCGAYAETRVKPFIMVILGGAGDLSQRRLLPALFHLYRDRSYFSEFKIVGVGLPEFSDDAYRDFMRTAIKTHAPEDFDQAQFTDFAGHLQYIPGDLEGTGAYSGICEYLGRSGLAGSDFNLVFYLAIPPRLLPSVIASMEKARLCRGPYTSKVIVEKPFGTDRESAAELNRLILGAFTERQIYRIDHYLGKETVQNILFFRFGNSIFEPLWNRRYIDHVQITVAEEIGIEHRGVFYEQAGVVMDMVQNHLMQLVGLVAMEPPVGFEADLVRDEKAKVFKTIRQMDDDYIDRYMVRGQYSAGAVGREPVPAYRQEKNVSPSSEIATFFAGRFYIDNWRFAGVPFYLRTGKRLARSASEIYVQFNQPPLRLLGRSCDNLEPNCLILGIQPHEKMRLRLSVKHPGMENVPYSVHMEFNYEKGFRIKRHPPYEVLIIDFLRGDQTLFARQDEIEAMWSVVDPIIKRWREKPAENFPNYAPGEMGPGESDQLMHGEGRDWHLEPED